MPKQKMVTVIGLFETIEDMQNARTVVFREGEKLLDDLGAYGVERAKKITASKGAIDLGELHRGIHHKTKSSFDEIETTIKPSEKADKYAIFVEKGTRPHRPPVKALQGWADRHGIPVWAVVRKIEREGTEPRHIFKLTFEDLDRKTDSELNKFAIKLLRIFRP